MAFDSDSICHVAISGNSRAIRYLDFPLCARYNYHETKHTRVALQTTSMNNRLSGFTVRHVPKSTS
ncbi:uncharacterized protein FTOL_00447 [Fusarium torulosum]|uniref:Uncharacterized protein n=1 Tax=Fusarium torulosum TaxID=33205 RepID=A0AAE8LYB6_9HYPO|nr:uncharacterized protein FTOL_00447 [Fusarium torulosum]